MLKSVLKLEHEFRVGDICLAPACNEHLDDFLEVGAVGAELLECGGGCAFHAPSHASELLRDWFKFSVRVGVVWAFAR